MKRLYKHPLFNIFAAVLYAAFVMPELVSAPSWILFISGFVGLGFFVWVGVSKHGTYWTKKFSSFAQGKAQVCLILAWGLFMGGCTCTRIEQGYTGVMADLIGGDKGGVTELTPGRVWYNPINKDVYTFPNFVQRVAWTATDDEGSRHDEAIRLLSQDQLEFTNDVGFSYYVANIKGCSKSVFVMYRTNIRTITNGPLRDIVRKEMQDVFSQYPASDIYGEKRPIVVQEIADGVAARMSRMKGENGEVCFVIEDFAILKLDPPGSVKDAVERKIQAAQDAQRERENLLKITYQSQQDSIRAVMDARNNRVMSESITPELLKWKQLELMEKKWNGQMPQVMSSEASGLMLQLPNN